MAHRVHFAVERLSQPGLALVHRGLREKWTFKHIIAELKKTTGEKLGYGNLQRYASRADAELRNLRLVREEVQQIIAEFKSGKESAADMVLALVQKALLDRKKELLASEPLKLSREDRERQKLELKREEIAYNRSVLQFNEKKLKAAEKRQQCAVDEMQQLEEKGRRGEDISPEDIRRIREQYGLRT